MNHPQVLLGLTTRYLASGVVATVGLLLMSACMAETGNPPTLGFWISLFLVQTLLFLGMLTTGVWIGDRGSVDM